MIQFAFLVRLERVWGAQEDSQGEKPKNPEIAKRVPWSCLFDCILGWDLKKNASASSCLVLAVCGHGFSKSDFVFVDLIPWREQ